MADDLDKQFDDSQKELKRLENEVNKASDAVSKKQLKTLKKLKLEYAKQSKVVKDLAKQIKALRVEKTHLTKVTEQLTSKFGGSAASVTKFTGGLKDAVFTTDNATGKMKMFGGQLGITANKFAGYAAGIQLAIAATITFLDWVDKLEKKQGTLQRAVGMAGVSIGASQRTMAKGWGIAGKAGEKAAEELTEIIAQSRKGLWEDLIGRKGENAGMDKLTTMTAGMSKQVPQWSKMLSETFAETSGQKMIDSMMKIGLVAYQANVPVDQFGNMVFDLAKEFVHLGVDVDDATAAIGVFVDEMGEGAIKPAVGLAAMRNIIQQQTTAAGLQGRFMTAAFSSQNFGSLDVNTQSVLNKRAKEITKDSNATWQSLDIGQQATTLKSLDTGQYAQVMRGLYEFLKTMPELIQTAIAPQVIGMEMTTAKEFWGNLKIGEDVGEKLAKKMETPVQAFKSAADQFTESIKENARLQQEFYSGLMEQLGMGKAAFADVYDKSRKGGMPIVEAVTRAYGTAAINQQQREAKEAAVKLEELRSKSSLTLREQGEVERQEAIIKVAEGTDNLTRLISLFIPDPESASRIVAPKGTGSVPGGQKGDVDIETPAGTVKVTITFDEYVKGIGGKPTADSSGTVCR